MRKRPINIIGGFYKDPNLHWSRQVTLNWIPVAAEQEGTLSPWQLRDAPGVKPFVRITKTVETEEGEVVIDVGPGRGLRNVEGKLFVVAGQMAYQISNTGVAIPVDTVPGVGHVSMAHNQYGLSNQLLIVNGSAGYVIDTNLLLLAKVTDEGYPGAFMVDFMDQYLVQIEPQGRYWFHSDLADALAYNTLDRYEAESDPDRIVSLIRSNTDLFVFGKESTDIFVNTGEQTGTFQSAANTGLTVGCSAKFTPRRMANSIYWLDDKRIVRRLNGYTDERISTDAIDAAFSECSEIEVAQAYAFTWETRGHKVYYITVPGRFTFGYDVLTRQWHQRSTWSLPHWDVIDLAFWNGKWIALSGQNGRLYELDQDYKLDRCDPLVRRRITGKLWDSENDLTLNNVELKFNTGGPVSVCAPFAIQPEGPAISGNAPGGTLQIPYIPYSYTVTPGDAPITRTVILVGNVPPGLSWNQNTATWSGTPTQMGSFEFTVRTYDQSGLYAQLEDEIVIGTVVMGLFFTDSVGGNSWQISNGADWSTTWTNQLLLENRQFLTATETAFIGFDYGGFPARTTNFGVSWSSSTGTPNSGVGGDRNAFYSSREGTLMIAQGLGAKATISEDDGATFSETNFEDVNSIAALELEETRWVSVNRYTGQVSISEDKGVSVTDTTMMTDASYGNGYCITAYEAELWYGATDGDLVTPKIWRTTDGYTMTPMVIDAVLTGVAIKGIHAGMIRGALRLIAWTNTYELLMFDGDKWVLSADQPDCLIRGADSNGAFFIIVGTKDNPSDNEGLIYTSVDGDSLVERLRQVIGNTEAFSSVAALRA